MTQPEPTAVEPAREITVMFDGTRWWVECTIAPGQIIPPEFKVEQRTHGWRLIDLDPGAANALAAALAVAGSTFETWPEGTYTLAGRGAWIPPVLDEETGAPLIMGHFESYDLTPALEPVDNPTSAE